MTRKQHIENLNRYNKWIAGANTKMPDTKEVNDSISYAIDHLSREWVSRNTHRKKVDEWKGLFKSAQKGLNEEKSKLRSEIFHANKFSVRHKLETEKMALKDEIGQLKADKDMLMDSWDKATENLGKFQKENQELKTEKDRLQSGLNSKFAIIDSLNEEVEQYKDASTHRLKAYQKAQLKVTWLSIACATLLITLLISLLK